MPPNILVGNLVAYAVQELEPYFTQETSPKHYSRTDTKYYTADLDGLMKPRGMYSKELISLAKNLPAGAVLAGSFVAAALMPARKPSDIDIFFTSGQAFQETYEILMNPPDTDHAWALKGYRPNVEIKDLLDRSKTIRVVNFKHPDPARLPIQLIKMVWYDNAEHTIDSFDFTVTQFAVSAGMLVFNPVSLFDLFNSNLIIHRHQYPMETLYRLVKYAKKGYKVSPRTYQKLVADIRASEELDPPLPFHMY